jgi:ubiquitin carboxyl-terminal hydrolase 8
VGSKEDGARAGQAGVNGAPDRSAASPARARPVVHPKPQGLHGNALQSAGSGVSSGKPAEDLAQRFARLRATPAQDPRIRTQSIIPPSATASQAPVESQQPTISSLGAVSGMPRLPDAIYNPARGTISSEAAELPSSAPRAMFSRTNSMTSIPNVSKTPKTGPVEEYFVPAQTFTSTTNPAPPKRIKLTISDGNTISAQELFEYMKKGAAEISILLIDIRSRELFDEGHIMSQATICLEADVLMRPDISANEIADSNVLAPADEMILFEKRHQFDLVVFYDQESDRITGRRDTPEQKAISGLYNALTQYDFPGNATKRTLAPKLLEGGLEAWTGILGKSGLQSSATSAPNKPRGPAPMARSLVKRRPTYVTRPVQDAEEAKKWEETLSDLSPPIRTTEDFLRRMPAMSTKQESMVTSPVTSPTLNRPMSPFHSRISHEESIYKNLPAPPTRPPPTLPRRSYSGLADAESGTSTATKNGALKSGAEPLRKFRTGLINPGVHCFANSSLQAMFATPGFSRELATGKWTESFEHPPKKRDEAIVNPQLLTKMLASLFNWLNTGAMPEIQAKTLMDYIRHINSRTVEGQPKPPNQVLGGPAQQDAEEFHSFVMANIHDETNMLRDRKPVADPKQYSEKDGSVLKNAIDYWGEYSLASSSIVDKYFRGLDVYISKCLHCHHEVRQIQTSDICILNLPTSGETTTLEALLKLRQRVETLHELQCEECKQKGRTRYGKFARLPDRLAICIGRFSMPGDHNAVTKINTRVRFPVRDLDLTEHCAQPDLEMKQTNDHHFAGRMRYDLYAVTVHQGSSVSSGHYFAYVRDDLSRDPTDWWKCNDTRVDRVKIGSSSPDDQTETMYKDGNATAYMLYYRRQDV